MLRYPAFTSLPNDVRSSLLPNERALLCGAGRCGAWCYDSRKGLIVLTDQRLLYVADDAEDRELPLAEIMYVVEGRLPSVKRMMGFKIGIAAGVHSSLEWRFISDAGKQWVAAIRAALPNQPACA